MWQGSGKDLLANGDTGREYRKKRSHLKQEARETQGSALLLEQLILARAQESQAASLIPCKDMPPVI